MKGLVKNLELKWLRSLDSGQVSGAFSDLRLLVEKIAEENTIK